MSSSFYSWPSWHQIILHNVWQLQLSTGITVRRFSWKIAQLKATHVRALAANLCLICCNCICCPIHRHVHISPFHTDCVLTQYNTKLNCPRFDSIIHHRRLDRRMQLVNRATSDITSLKSDPELSISLLYTIITIHVVHHTFTRTVLHKDRHREREREGERVNWNGVKNIYGCDSLSRWNDRWHYKDQRNLSSSLESVKAPETKCPQLFNLKFQ